MYMLDNRSCKITCLIAACSCWIMKVRYCNYSKVSLMDGTPHGPKTDRDNLNDNNLSCYCSKTH